MLKMATSTPPATMKAWQYASTKGGIPANLKLNPAAATPVPKPHQLLVQILYTSLNPIDYKPAEIPAIGRLLVPRHATPGLDFCGHVLIPPAAPDSPFKRGALVFGVAGTNPLAGGGLAQYAVVDKDSAVAVPEGLAPLDAATAIVAGLTAYQTILPHLERLARDRGSEARRAPRVFINGGSGGVGCFGIQIAKVAGCFVVTSCSGRNVALCKELGADVVIDYEQVDVMEEVVRIAAGEGGMFDLVVDNVGNDDRLYWRAHEYTVPEAVFQGVGGSPSLGAIGRGLKMAMLPGVLGGARRKRAGYLLKGGKESCRELEKLGQWMVEGKVKAVVDETFAFEDAPKALLKLKTGRARGKIVVDIGGAK